MRLLVAEDERLLADAVAEALRREALAVDAVYDGCAALECLLTNDYDVVILDRDLPIVHGDEICRRVVTERPDTRILMLTAASELEDRVAGLELGADDYLPKPFALAELRARVHALGRRSRAVTPPLLERHDIILDSNRREAYRSGRHLSLTRKEFAVLEELLRAQCGVVSAEHLLEKVWDQHIDPFTNTVRVTVMKLRRKLGDPAIVATVPGWGYRIS